MDSDVLLNKDAETEAAKDLIQFSQLAIRKRKNVAEPFISNTKRLKSNLGNDPPVKFIFPEEKGGSINLKTSNVQSVKQGYNVNDDDDLVIIKESVVSKCQKIPSEAKKVSLHKIPVQKNLELVSRKLNLNSNPLKKCSPLEPNSINSPPNIVQGATTNPKIQAKSVAQLNLEPEEAEIDSLISNVIPNIFRKEDVNQPNNLKKNFTVINPNFPNATFSFQNENSPTNFSQASNVKPISQLPSMQEVNIVHDDIVNPLKEKNWSNENETNFDLKINNVFTTNEADFESNKFYQDKRHFVDNSKITVRSVSDIYIGKGYPFDLFHLKCYCCKVSFNLEKDYIVHNRSPIHYKATMAERKSNGVKKVSTNVVTLLKPTCNSENTKKKYPPVGCKSNNTANRKKLTPIMNKEMPGSKNKPLIKLANNVNHHSPLEPISYVPLNLIKRRIIIMGHLEHSTDYLKQKKNIEILNQSKESDQEVNQLPIMFVPYQVRVKSAETGEHKLIVMYLPHFDVDTSNKIMKDCWNIPENSWIGDVQKPIESESPVQFNDPKATIMDEVKVSRVMAPSENIPRNCTWSPVNTTNKKNTVYEVPLYKKKECPVKPILSKDICQLTPTMNGKKSVSWKDIDNNSKLEIKEPENKEESFLKRLGLTSVKPPTQEQNKENGDGVVSTAPCSDENELSEYIDSLISNNVSITGIGSSPKMDNNNLSTSFMTKVPTESYSTCQDYISNQVTPDKTCKDKTLLNLSSTCKTTPPPLIMEEVATKKNKPVLVLGNINKFISNPSPGMPNTVKIKPAEFKLLKIPVLKLKRINNSIVSSISCLIPEHLNTLSNKTSSNESLNNSLSKKVKVESLCKSTNDNAKPSAMKTDKLSLIDGSNDVLHNIASSFEITNPKTLTSTIDLSPNTRSKNKQITTNLAITTPNGQKNYFLSIKPCIEEDSLLNVGTEPKGSNCSTLNISKLESEADHKPHSGSTSEELETFPPQINQKANSKISINISSKGKFEKDILTTSSNEDSISLENCKELRSSQNVLKADTSVINLLECLEQNAKSISNLLNEVDNPCIKNIEEYNCPSDSSDSVTKSKDKVKSFHSHPQSPKSTQKRIVNVLHRPSTNTVKILTNKNKKSFRRKIGFNALVNKVTEDASSNNALDSSSSFENGETSRLCTDVTAIEGLKDNEITNEDLKSNEKNEDLKESVTNKDLEEKVTNVDLEEILTNEDIESNVANEDLESNVANEDLKENVANEDLEENVANEDLEENVANEDLDENVVNEDLEENVAYEDLEENVANEDLEENVANEDLDENVVNEDLEENVAYEDLEENVANEDLEENVANEHLEENVANEDLYDNITEIENGDNVTLTDEELEKSIIDDQIDHVDDAYNYISLLNDLDESLSPPNNDNQNIQMLSDKLVDVPLTKSEPSIFEKIEVGEETSNELCQSNVQNTEAEKSNLSSENQTPPLITKSQENKKSTANDVKAKNVSSLQRKQINSLDNMAKCESMKPQDEETKLILPIVTSHDKQPFIGTILKVKKNSFNKSIIKTSDLIKRSVSPAIEDHHKNVCKFLNLSSKAKEFDASNESPKIDLPLVANIIKIKTGVKPSSAQKVQGTKESSPPSAHCQIKSDCKVEAQDIKCAPIVTVIKSVTKTNLLYKDSFPTVQIEKNISPKSCQLDLSKDYDMQASSSSSKSSNIIDTSCTKPMQINVLSNLESEHSDSQGVLKVTQTNLLEVTTPKLNAECKASCSEDSSKKSIINKLVDSLSSSTESSSDKVTDLSIDKSLNSLHYQSSATDIKEKLKFGDDEDGLMYTFSGNSTPKDSLPTVEEDEWQENLADLEVEEDDDYSKLLQDLQ